MITKNKILFRFLCLFFTQLIIPFPLNVIPDLDIFDDLFAAIYQQIIPWIGTYIWGLENEAKNAMTGSGDRMFDYLQLFFFLVLAIIGTIIWTLVERKNRDYERLNHWFLVLLRYFLGYTMLSYGMVKVIQLQFPDPSFYRLLQPYGNSSPMGLAWTFLGFSKGYNLFMGLSEVIGGILLFHRRTTLLGSLILIAVSSNIVAVNFFYDVPVKLFSSELLIMAILIMLPNLPRLLNVILLNKPTMASTFKAPFTAPNWILGKRIIKWSFIVGILFFEIKGALDSQKMYGNSAPKPALYGLYETTALIKNGEPVPALLSNQEYWRYITIEYMSSIQISGIDLKRKGFKSEIDTIEQQLKFSSFRDSTIFYDFDYVQTDSTLHLKGRSSKGNEIELKAKRKTKKDFLLTNRGFHWISERPYNR